MGPVGVLPFLLIAHLFRFRQASAIFFDETRFTGEARKEAGGKGVNLPPTVPAAVIHRLSRAVAVHHLGER